MAAIHVRNVPEHVVTALRERAARHGRSMQEEIRQILAAAAMKRPVEEALEPLRLQTVRTRGTSTWRREQMYGSTGR